MDKHKSSKTSSMVSTMDLPNEHMKEWVASTVKLENDKTFQKQIDQIVKCLDPNQNEWVPWKTKKSLADSIIIILKTGSAKHSAREKLLALKLLNKAILEKNQQFNRYIEANLMDHLYQFAKTGGQGMDSGQKVHSKSGKYSSQIIQSKGLNLFGPEGKDVQSTTTFLMLLLSCIERWSQILYEKSDEPAKTGVETTFKKVYSELKRLKIKFPSAMKHSQTKSQSGLVQQESLNSDDKPAKKQVRFHLDQEMNDENNKEGEQPQIQLTQEQLRNLQSLKRKMIRVKEGAKVCKKFLSKNQKPKDKDNSKDNKFDKDIVASLEQNFLLCKKCLYFLKQKEYSDQISNSKQLHQKMKKYHYKFEEALTFIKARQDTEKKFKSQIPSVEQLEVGGLGLGKKQNSDEKLTDFSFFASKDQNDVDKDEFDFWQINDGGMQDPQDQENLALFDSFQDHIEPDEDGQVFIELETTLNTNMTEQESFSLGQLRQNEAEQRQIVNKGDVILLTKDKSRAKSGNKNDDKNVISFDIRDFDKNIDQLDKSELRRPKDPQSASRLRNFDSASSDKVTTIGTLRQELSELKEENQELKNGKKMLLEKLQRKQEFELNQDTFEDCPLIRDYEQAISQLNIELMNSKKEQKAQIKEMKDEHNQEVNQLKLQIKSLQDDVASFQDIEQNYKDQIAQVHQAMNVLGAKTEKKLEEKNDLIQELENQVQTLKDQRSKQASTGLNILQEQNINKYAQNSPSQDKILNKNESNCLSPLNFSQLAGNQNAFISTFGNNQNGRIIGSEGDGSQKENFSISYERQTLDSFNNKILLNTKSNDKTFSGQQSSTQESNQKGSDDKFSGVKMSNLMQTYGNIPQGTPLKSNRKQEQQTPNQLQILAAEGQGQKAKKKHVSPQDSEYQITEYSSAMKSNKKDQFYMQDGCTGTQSQQKQKPQMNFSPGFENQSMYVDRNPQGQPLQFDFNS